MKITRLYIDKAVYKVQDDLGHELWMEIDYWNNKFKVNKKNTELEDFAKKLLKKKHRVNFAYKMLE